ncbi:MAG TPA: DUF5995 family protein [Agriterribacter sp.]|nr:DUF5995 family protein [Agriterribacter sp.]
MAPLHISDVISRLDEIVNECKASKSRMGYFGALYKRMTMAVSEGMVQGVFEDGERMNRLDVVFAQYYLDAYNAYKFGRQCSKSWKFAFDSCGSNQLTVIQHILLGVNAHINLDLAVAAATVSAGSEINDLSNDFNKINDVIASQVDDVQEALANVWLPMRLLGKIANGRQDAVLNFSIDKARTASWSSALLLAGMTSDQQQFYIRQMDATVFCLAERIESPGLVAEMILKGIRATEYDDIARTIHLIDTSVVN